MKKHLILPLRSDCNTNDIWRAGINRDWSVYRADMSGKVDLSKPYEKIRYYGDILHGRIISEKTPIRFYPIDLNVLAKTNLTKRKVEIIKAENLNIIEKDTFIKPAQEKWFNAKVYHPNEWPGRLQGGAILGSDLIYVQEPLDMINEVRCFCLDGKILTASYYSLGHEYCPLGIDDVDRPEILDKMVEELAPFYPKGIVLDFAYTSKKEWCFIEPNEAWASGLYGCNPIKCLEVIEASQYEEKWYES